MIKKILMKLILTAKQNVLCVLAILSLLAVACGGGGSSDSGTSGTTTGTTGGTTTGTTTGGPELRSICGGTATNLTSTGTAGRDWIEVTSDAGFTARSEFRAVVFKGALFVIGGSTRFGTGRTNDVWCTDDGITWKEVAKETTDTSRFSARSAHASVVFDSGDGSGDTLWVIGGINIGGNYLDDVWKSTDGITWNEVTSDAAFGDRAHHTVTVFNNAMYLIGGESPLRANDVWRSQNGKTWAPVTIAGTEGAGTHFSERGFHRTVVFNNAMYLIGGSANTGFENDVWKSNSDGTVWTTTDAGFSGRFSHGVVVFNDGTGEALWVIGGKPDRTNYMNNVWKSNSDGTAWTEATSDAGFSARYEFGAVVFNNAMWVIGGDGARHKNDVWRSKP